MRHLRIVAGAIMCAMVVSTHDAILACTAFCAVGKGRVLVGNNEDWNNPRTKIRFVPAKSGSYGRLYVGFDDLWPQGGMNERGLWFDGFSVPSLDGQSPSSDLPHFQGNIVEKAMAECATVEEVIRLFSKYNRDFLRASVFMFADAAGDAVSIERDAMVRKTRTHFVQTNFHQSRPRSGLQDERFEIASKRLSEAGEEISIDLFRRILSATHQRGGSPTLYSNIYDLQSRTMHLYYFHDFERVVSFDLAEELKKGERVIDIPALFPLNAAAERFAARQRDADVPEPRGALIAILAVPLIVVAVGVYAWIHAGRRFRLGLVALVGGALLLLTLSVVTLRMRRDAASGWTTFSIAPASGRSAGISPTGIRSDGMTLKGTIAFAYEVPPVRIIAPAWLADARYSINAAVAPEASHSVRALMQEELKKRLGVETHFEVRPFDVFILTAGEAPRLERAARKNPSIWIRDSDAELQNASMQRLAGTLQDILGKPVIDETGIEGTFNFDLEWSDDRVRAITTLLQRQFGLRLSPAKRNMEALVVDSVRRDASMVLLAEIGRITRTAPPQLRRTIASVLTVH